jgi:hypothetical protein
MALDRGREHDDERTPLSTLGKSRRAALGLALSLSTHPERRMAEPGSYVVTRSIAVATSPDRIHPLIDDFHEWTKWSPWEGLDPAMQRTYSGPDSGVGASYAWSGNRKAGQGRMTITGSSPSRVDIDLHFDKPMKADDKTTFDLAPSGGPTQVTWTLRGTTKGIWRLLSRLYPMDRLVGKDFEKGLAQLKRAAESAG